MHKYY